MNFRLQLMDMWKDYYKRDGITKQKGYKQDFSVFSPMEASLQQIVQELENMTQTLSSSIPNESQSQKEERIFNTISQKYEDLVQNHTQARKNGRIKESLATIFKNFPLLLSYIKKSITTKDVKKILFNPNISTEVKKAILEDIPSSIVISDLEPVQSRISEKKQIVNKKVAHPSSPLPATMNFTPLEEIDDDLINKLDNNNTYIDDEGDGLDVIPPDDEGDILDLLNDNIDPNTGTLNFRGNTYDMKLGNVKLEERHNSIINAYHRLERIPNIPQELIRAYNVSVNNVIDHLDEVDKLPQGTKNIRAIRQNADDLASNLIKKMYGVVIGYNNRGKTKNKNKNKNKNKKRNEAQAQENNNEWRDVVGSWSEGDFNSNDDDEPEESTSYNDLIGELKKNNFPFDERNQGLGKLRKRKTLLKKQAPKKKAVQIKTKPLPKKSKSVMWSIPKGINLW